MAGRPSTVPSESVDGIEIGVPEPLKKFYRAVLPDDIRANLRNQLRAGLFWLKPRRRRDALGELHACTTVDDYFDFATKHFGHLQLKKEIVDFLCFAAEHAPARICEVGLSVGGTNVMLTHALTSVRLVIGVDLHVLNRSQLRYFAGPARSQVLIDGPSCSESTLDTVQHSLGSEKLDLLFIDADHSYAGVRQDFLGYRRFVRDGGIVAFHDIVQDHRRKSGSVGHGGADGGDVYLFWRRLKPFYRFTQEFVADYEQDGRGIGALLYDSKVNSPDVL